MTTTGPKVVSLQARAETHEEYTQILLPPVSLSSPRSFTAVHDRVEGKRVVELLALNEQGKPVHFAHNRQSESGWTEIPISIPDPPAAEVREILGFFATGRLHALVRWAGWPAPTRAMFRTLGGQWSPLPLSDAAASLLANTRSVAVARTHAGHGCIYGISADFKFFLLSPSGAKWGVALTEAVQKDRYFVLPGKEDDDLTILRGHSTNGSQYYLRSGKVVNGSFQGGSEEQIYFSLQNEIDSIQPFPPQPKATQGHFHWLLLQQDSTTPIYMFINGEKKVTLTPFENLGVRDAQIMSDREGKGMIFGVTTGEKELVVRRQKDVLDNGLRRFHDWSRTGDIVKGLAVPRFTTSAPEVFIVRKEDDRVLHLVEEGREGTWHASVVAVPKPAADKVESMTVHSLDVLALSSSGEPVPDATVVVKASRASTITINGVVHQVDPVFGLTAKTDYSGRLVFKSRASDLTAPELRLHVPDFMSQGQMESYEIASAFYRRLAGLDPKYPVTPATLRAQKVLPSQSEMEDAKAEEVAKAVRRFGSALAKAGFAASEGPGPKPGGFQGFDLSPAGWEFDFKPENPSERMTVKPIPKKELVLASGSSQDTEVEPANLWQWLGDILRKIGAKLEDVKKVVVKLAQEVVELVIYLVNETRNLVVKGVSAIAGALELLFDRIRAAYNMTTDFAAQAVKWLRQVFEWDDIVRTHDVILHTLSQQLVNLETLCSTTGVSVLRDAATSLKAKLSDSIVSAKQALGPNGALAGKNLRSLYNPQGGPTDPVLDSALFQTSQENRVRLTYLFDQVQAHSGSIADGLPSSPISEADRKAFNDLVENLKKALTNHGFQSKAEAMGTWFKDLKDPKKLVVAALSGMLDAVELAVTAGIEVTHAVLEALLKLVAVAVRSLRKMATQPLTNIPVLSALYKQMTGQDMTLCGIVALGAAIPGTILYKVIKNTAPFTAEQVKLFTATTLPGGDATWLVEGPKDADLAGTDILIELQRAATILSGILMLPYSLLDMILDGLSAVKATVSSTLLVVLNAVFLLLTLATICLAMPFRQMYVLGIKRTPNDWTAIVVYGISLADIFFSGVLFHFSGKISRQFDVIGGALACVTGVIVGGTGLIGYIVAAAVSGELSGPAIGDSVMAAIPRGAELTLSIPQLIGPKLATALAWIDFIGDVAAGSCRIRGALV